MGLDPISTATPTATIQASLFNKLIAAIKGDFIPRNASGTGQTGIGSLGTSTIKWLKAHIEAGYWRAGDFKYHHSYNGLVPAGQGWMKADGRIINQTNYDAEHGAGSWATYVGASPLEGKYLPNVNDRYLVGGSTTAPGNVAIPNVGNAGNQRTFQHTHSMAHTHSVPAPTGIVNVQAGSGTTVATSAHTHTTAQPSDANTGIATAAENIQPDSIVAEVYMRII